MSLPWHEFSFDIIRSNPAKTKWWVDLWILDTVVRDVVGLEELRIASWHVHRRSADPDPNGAVTGHAFMLKCQALDHAAIKDAIRARPTLGAIRSMLVQDLRIAPNQQPSVDSHWDSTTNEVWADLAHGMSEGLLGAVGTLRCRVVKPQCADFRGWGATEAENLYTQVDDQMLRVWNLDWDACIHHVRCFLGYPQPQFEHISGRYPPGMQSVAASLQRPGTPYRGT
jgi:hypothetical protein